MIDFKSKHLVDRGYSQHLLGNGGEAELIVITSWGQDRKSSCLIVGCTVDGAVTVLYDSKKRVILANILGALDRVIEKWSKQGIKPTADQMTKLDVQRKKVCDRLAELYETGELPAPVKKSKKEKRKSKEMEDALRDLGSRH